MLTLSTVPKQSRGMLGEIGNTPLVELKSINPYRSKNIKIFAKLENFNPGGSVKDRPALRMIEQAEEEGSLTHNKIILDATSGNTGIAFAMIGAVKGYSVELVMPENVSEERKVLLKAYGAKRIDSSGLEGSDGAILLAQEIYQREKEKYFMPDQYNNPENWKSHYFHTAEEIIQQIQDQNEEPLTHFVAGIGTSGTLVGTSKKLKEWNPKIQCYGVQPAESFHGLEGLKHIESSIVPGIYDLSFQKDCFFVSTDESYKMLRTLAQTEGLFMGLSSGSALLACLQLAQKLDQKNQQASIVTVFPDGGERYFSSNLY